MERARWLIVLLAALAGSRGVNAQPIFTFTPWTYGGLTLGPGPVFTHQRPRLSYSLYLWNSPGLFGGYYVNPFAGLATNQVTVFYYPAPLSVPSAPVVLAGPARRALNEEQELDLLLQRLDIPRVEPRAAAEPLDPGAQASVFRPILPGDRVRAQLPELPEPPAKRRADASAKPRVPAVPEARPPRAEPPPLPGPPVPAADPKVAAAEQIQLGKEAFAAQEYGRAERRFQQAAALSAREATAPFLLAQAEFAQGKYREAVLAIQAGLRAQPAWPSSRFRPRELYGLEGNEFADQLKRLAEALARYPDDPFLLFLYAYELWFDGRRDEAWLLFQRARATSPEPNLSERFLQPTPAFPVMIW